MQKTWSWKNMYVVLSFSVVVFMVIGIVGCQSLKHDRDDSPTTPSGSAVELGNYAQQSGQSRVVTVNGATHQINGVISGSVVAGGLYVELNEQAGVGSPSGTNQVMMNLRDVKLTFTELPSGISAITVKSDDTTLGAYAVSDGSVVIALTAEQWAQWFGPSHYAVVCMAVGEGRLVEAMAAVSGRLPSGEVVTFGKGFSSACPAPAPVTVTSGGDTSPACPECPEGTVGASCDLLNDQVSTNFNDNGDGTVSDSRSGLMWLKDAGCLGSGNWNGGANAGSVQAFITALNGVGGGAGCQDYTAGTYSDWRLPTVQEFVSLMQYSGAALGMPAGHPFTSIATLYWTADASPGSGAWHMHLAHGVVNNDVESKLYAGWAVR